MNKNNRMNRKTIPGFLTTAFLALAGHTGIAGPLQWLMINGYDTCRYMTFQTVFNRTSPTRMIIPDPQEIPCR